MAKMIANYMKSLLSDIILVSQSINILVASKVGQFFRRKQSGKVGWATLKLDMTKGYDRMDGTISRVCL